ncbi:fatty acid oxidation complex subunit alpha FadJ [Corallococcus exiguus]|uniref:fatty acid oxidation complex subunit alpha FadJ n=1 Tax=Corallococcus exiguus TaxID=83462 RepID=UPI001A8CB2E9|nr:fatty acid oxidation complex subunit alpha FadJ [Corallococcus exiguus]MBN8468542.1 fatty acid oxidation complex subunit alpha FadJ [Corallococcus exiguus]MBN8472530.1 fatty acid oxidation complex subunit alpha FadJ [Corallococcus exiguus]MBN8473112.1 fatty acid oxidation complex subunit alpha FadJ [Corallococcus exiguus]MBN8473126.1 fatty acid oxidation complex subunit alpha FadJ [Corallococcus exiguus]MBN8473133.1 fatty acid oxidation complex subunit alpha FadJ [Corallococcus exiguus]
MATKQEAVEAKQGLSYDVTNGVAVITVDQPGAPVNTLSPDVGAAFSDLLLQAERDPEVKAVVFISGKKDNFVAGANIDFLQTIKSPADVEAISRAAHAEFDRLEVFSKPVVAAIHGACLGGGLEWALACHYRIVTDSPKSVVGLPETQLGLIPGAGGTQRLPALIGAEAALDLILTGKNVKPSKAKKLGVVDEVVPVPMLKDIALKRAAELAAGTLKVERSHQGFKAVAQSGKKKGIAGLFQGLINKDLWKEAALEDNPLGRKVMFDQAKKQLLKKTRGKYPAQEKALQVIRVGLESGRKAGLEAEAKAFGELVFTDVSRRLVEIFFATTALKKENGTANPNLKPREVKKVGVLGGGLMGGGIAYVAGVLQGVPVRVKDRDDAGAGRALKQVQTVLDERVKRRSLTRLESNAKLSNITAGTDYSGFKSVDLIIEAVFEDLKLKHQVIAEVEAVTGENTIFASNTSSLPIGELAKGSKRPSQVIGMHYFSPVHKMPLLEIITHPGTAEWVTATCVDVGKKQGKTVIVVNDGPGFYTSRILAPYMNEAAYLLAEGADIVQLDKALVDFGFPVGPITLLDEVGIDVAQKVGPIMEAAFGKRMAAPKALEGVVSDGRLGRKTNKGFYLYENGKKKEVDPQVYLLLPHGKDRKSLDASEMAERVALQMVNEAIRCLGEGILRSPRDGDVGAIFGLGFPPFLGGPFRYADALGPANLLRKLEHYQDKYGERFTPAPLLVEKVRANKGFYES